MKVKAEVNPGIRPDTVMALHGWWQGCKELGKPFYPLLRGFVGPDLFGFEVSTQSVVMALVGGGGQSAVWSRIFADVLGVEVRQVRDAIQANARGAAWIAAAGLGEIAFADLPGLVGIEEVFAPQAANRAVYDERFAAFLEIHKRMRTLYRRLNRDAPVAPRKATAPVAESARGAGSAPPSG